MSRTVALSCIESGVAAANPKRAVCEQLTLDDDQLIIQKDTTVSLTQFDRVVVAGGGKAAVAVARGLETVLGDRIDEGVIVTDEEASVSSIDVVVGDHPVPSERSIEGTDRVRSLLDAADERTLVLAPVTGGGSALLVGPVNGVSLDDLRATTQALLESGAPIDAMNAVRKHLSAVKGGGLARLAEPATVHSLLVSDVVGDDTGTIASGPFVPDPTTNSDALSVLDRYGIDAPDSVRSHLEQGEANEVSETSTNADGDGNEFDHVHTTMLVTNRTALDAAAETAREHGYRSLILSSSMRGEAREIALPHVACAEECLASGNPVEPPTVLLSGGEATVTVTGDGQGGPNTEFALAAAIDLPERVTLASIDTDGRDGATDAAGAIVDAETVDDREREAAQQALADNDAYSYLDARDALVHIDSTTNVNDLRVVVVDESREG